MFQTQEREAREQAKRMAKELQQARRDAQRGGMGRAGLSGIGSSAMGNSAVTNGSMMDMSPTEPQRLSHTSTPV